ncbi:MAG: phosphoribosyltransferase [Candidatus Bipolaricaulota bacterium]|nr:phosphoribosyltransferase [Candidatus Bipolaricaulota bacterium]
MPGAGISIIIKRREIEVMDSYNHYHSHVLDLSWDEFGRLCKELAQKIRSEYAPEVVVGIAKGGVIPGVVLASAFSVDFFPIKLSRRHNERIVRKEPKIFVPPTTDLKGKRVLLVDDICIQMQTLNYAKAEIQKIGPREVRCATFAVHKNSKMPEWYAICTDALILMPWDRDVLVKGMWRLNPEYEEEMQRVLC